MNGVSYRRVILALLLTAIFSMALTAQQWGRRGRSSEWQSVGRNGVPTWEVDKPFSKDLFTFVRIKYDSGGYGYGRGGGGWATDFRDSELNFTLRLQQLTSMKVDPEPIVLELTDPKLFDYPFIYIIEPGALMFHTEEVVALRRYLLNGGFLMVDDFWGEDEWEGFYDYFSQVFPGKELVELDVSHPIFNTPFPLKRKPQIPNVQTGTESVWFNNGVTWERDDAKVPHYRALFDDNGRMMAIICHNTDIGDAWEREGENVTYFHEFSEKWSYPMGINIVTYAMTH